MPGGEPRREEFIDHAKSETTTFAEAHFDPAGARFPDESLVV